MRKREKKNTENEEKEGVEKNKMKKLIRSGQFNVIISISPLHVFLRGNKVVYSRFCVSIVSISARLCSV